MKRVVSSRLVQACYTSAHFPHDGTALHSPGSALHSPGLSQSAPPPPPPSPRSIQDFTNLSKEMVDMKKEMVDMKKEMVDMKKDIVASQRSIAALSVPYINVVAGEVLLWISGVQLRVVPGASSALHRAKAYEVLINSTSVAEILQLKEYDYEKFLVTILGDRNNSAHWKTLESLGKAVEDAKAMVEHFPTLVGEEQILVLQNFDKLRDLITGVSICKDFDVAPLQMPTMS